MPDVRIRYVVDSSQLHAAESTLHGLSKEEQEQVNNFKKINSEAQKAGQSIDKAGKQGKDSLSGLNNAAKSVGGAIAAYFTVTAIIDFGKRVVEVTSQFQKFTAVLTNTLGSQTAAAVALQKISDFAAKTNFSVQELTESYIKFANRGIKLTVEEMRKLGDLANSTGKSFDQLTEAVLDSFTGENERLKEFGITAKKTGETTQFTFKGITTEVKNTDEAVKAYLLSLGDLTGVIGSTEKISQTLNGQISNLGDAFDQLFVTIGNGSNGVFSFFITQLTEYVTWVKNALKSTQQFNEEIANVRADKFISTFKTLGEQGRQEQESSVRADIQLQTRLIKELDAARKKNTIILGQGGGSVTTTEDKSKQQKELELALQTNEKRLELIKQFYVDEAKETEKGEAGLTDKQKKELEKRAKAEADYWRKRRQMGRDMLDKLEDIAGDLGESALKSKEDAEKAAAEKQNKLIERMKKEGKEIQEVADNQRKEDERLEKLHQDRVASIRQAAFDVGTTLLNGLYELAAQNRDAEARDIETKRAQELKRVGDDKQAQAFINAKFDRQEAALKTKQAQADKQQALFNVLIQTASGIMKAVSDFPETFGLPFSAFVAAQGAIQAAVIAARPIPKFREGTEWVEGPGTATSDSILARLSVGERVVPEGINRQLAGIPNIELPKIVAIGYDALMKQTTQSGNYRNELHEEIKGLRNDLKRIPHNSINMDEKGFKKFIFQGDSVTQVLNNQFNK